MARIKYYYDTETCKYERIKTKPVDIVMNAMGFLMLALSLSIGIYFVFSAFFESPKEMALKNENQELKYYYETIKKDLHQLEDIAVSLEYNDNNIYRVVMGAEPIDASIRDAGIGGTDKYADLNSKDFDSKGLVLETRKKIDKIKRKYFIQNQSHEELQELVKNKEQLLAAIPAIRPVADDPSVRLASGYGYRYHPIYKVRKLHTGIDFSAPTGTPIYASADGKIVTMEVSFKGYGKHIEIDHGFGFVTKYAHMHEFAVKLGQKVKRGDLIGYVGNTGLSTASHLHYEVFRNGARVNPINYFFNDLTPEEYEKLVELSNIENQSLGM